MDVRAQQSQQQRLKDEIEKLERSKRDSLAAYGFNVGAATAAIERAHRAGRFRVRPIGPLGWRRGGGV
jgi:hypothetical protein